ncbi:MAG: carbon-nitrogen hydrolase [Planctomycetes bacterium]|nr:carbon-nitrogen hydrolase [Planctomycetota bacterium]
MHDRQSFALALVQMSCGIDPAANLDKAIDRIEEAAKAGADVICLPELFRSQYFCQRVDPANFELAESIPGRTTERLQKIAKGLGKVIVASLFERRGPGIYHNTAVVIDADGALLGLYRKMHIPEDPLYFEKYYFTPGDLGFKTFDTRFVRIGVLVCWDQWFPEGARLTALQGAQLLVYPTAIGWHPREKAEFGVSQHQAWETIQRSHAIANGVYVAAVNRVGHEGPADEESFIGGLEFWGGSFVSDPFGNVHSRGSHDREELVVSQCDMAKLDEIRRNWPFLRDRRIDAYGDIGKRYA